MVCCSDPLIFSFNLFICLQVFMIHAAEEKRNHIPHFIVYDYQASLYLTQTLHASSQGLLCSCSYPVFQAVVDRAALNVMYLYKISSPLFCYSVCFKLRLCYATDIQLSFPDTLSIWILWFFSLKHLGKYMCIEAWCKQSRISSLLLCVLLSSVLWKMEVQHTIQFLQTFRQVLGSRSCFHQRETAYKMRFLNCHETFARFQMHLSLVFSNKKVFSLNIRTCSRQ